MKKLLYSAGTSFMRAFGVGVLTYSVGILAAPNLSVARALSIAALAASLAAGLRAFQVFVPSISFAAFVKQPIAAWADAFTRAFLAFGLTGITGWLATPDLATWRTVGLATLTGALTAGIRAIQGLATPGETPAPAAGV